MTLLDDLQRVVSVQQGTRSKIKAVGSARWIFERNPGLSLAQQAEGIAFLVAAYLRETEAEVRNQYTQIISLITWSRPYQVGTQIDWATLTSALSHLPSAEVNTALYLLRSATDERYLSLLEHYFNDIEHYHVAVSSWVILAYTQRYTYDSQVLSPLQEAQKVIEGRFADARRRLLEKFREVKFTKGITREEFLRSEPWFRNAKAWARQQFASAEKHIRQHIQVRDRTAYMKEYEEKKLVQTEPTYFPNRIQRMLALPSREEKGEAGLGQLARTFEYDLSLPIDEAAHAVKVLMDYALTGEDTSVRGLIWDTISTAFEVRRYVGTYLDWDRLTDVLFQLNEDGKNLEFGALRSVLFCLGYANDERYLDVLKPYLDHRDVDVRWAAVQAITNLLCHLAYYCSEVNLLLRETGDIFLPQWKIPITSERWQLIKDRLEQLEHDTRPYFHYYSI